jgi:hypothetical protein
MAGSTPIYGFPYPQSTDLVADYPTLGQELATDVETVISGLGSGLNLISATSIANSGGSATRTNGQVAFTAVNSISLNGVFSATYDNYRVYVDLTASSGTGTLNMRLRSGGTDNSAASSYRRQGAYSYGTTVGAGLIADSYILAAEIGAYPTYTNWSADIRSPFKSVVTTGQASYFYYDGSVYPYVVAGINHNVASSFDGITFYASAGSITGIVRVYGYKNS